MQENLLTPSIDMSALDASHTALLERLRGLVETRHTTQMEIARATGIHQSQISRILSGNIRRSSPNVLRLCKYAEVTCTKSHQDVDLNSSLTALMERLAKESPSEALALKKVIDSLVEWRTNWGAAR